MPRRVPCQSLGKERFERKSCWDSALRCGKKLLVKQLRSSGAVRKLRRATPFSQLHCRAPGRRDAGSFQVTERVSCHLARFMSRRALQRDCRQWAYLPSHATGPAGTITWRRASFTDLTRTAKATCVRKARRQGGWRRAGLAASSASPRSQSRITLQS